MCKYCEIKMIHLCKKISSVDRSIYIIKMDLGNPFAYFFIHCLMQVLRKFGIPDPCTFVEIDIEALL
jgi:hypothetical protein